MQCKSAVLAMVLACGMSLPAAAQNAPPAAAPFTIPAADVASSYCVYGSMLYSIGAVIGVGEGGPPMAIRCSENRQWQTIAAPPGPPPGRR
jgi:hypothetical protein